MSKPFRGFSQPQIVRLRPDLVLIEYSDPGAEPVRMSTNTYVLLRAGRMLLMDTSVSSLLPFVRKLCDEGFSPAALVIPHRHVIGLGDAVGAMVSEFDIPVLLHPIDAKHPQALAANVPFENPIGHPVLDEFGFEALLFPGHTAGHIVIYSNKHGGLLFTGDAAMGTTADQSEAGLERLIRPPIETNVDDEKLREQWLVFDRPVVTVLPYHGTGYLDRSAGLAAIMRPLNRPEPTYGLRG